MSLTHVKNTKTIKMRYPKGNPVFFIVVLVLHIAPMSASPKIL